MSGWAATNTLRESMFVCGCDAGSEGERRQIQQEQGKSLDALALVEAALDAAAKADAVLREYMPEWYGDREWPELDALAAALRAVRGGK